MSLNNSQMLPARVRNMRQMNDVLNAEDIILAEIERIIDEMYQRASLLHEELPKIVGFVFGDGGVDADGNVIAPLEAESELKNELLRKKYDTYTMLSDTKCKYECELKESELPGAAISEIGLYDADGDIVTIKRFTAKGKDADISMTFYINDTF